MGTDQLSLLLWKNYVIRKRQPVILALTFLWPMAVFLILYTLRDNVETEYHPTCQFPARSMPHDGLLPFVQSFICGVGNPCDSLSQYEEMPTYRNATLNSSLLNDMQTMVSNETILSAVKTLPKSVQLLQSMAQILTRPEIKALFDRGIRLADLFDNHQQIKGFLRAQMPQAQATLFDALFRSSIRLYYLIDTLGSSNVEGVVCSVENLKKYLIVPKEEDLQEISKALCDVDSNRIPEILQELSKHLDFDAFLRMVDRATAKFRDYDFFRDLKQTVETVLNLKTFRKYVPAYLKVQQWLPEIIMLFRNVTFREIDLTFINKSVGILNPIFQSEKDWSIARHGFVKLNSLLAMVKDIEESKDSEMDSIDDFSSIIFNVGERIKDLSAVEGGNLTRIFDLLYVILRDGMKLTNKLLDRHNDEIFLAAEVLDALKDYFSLHVVNTLTYVVSLLDNAVKMVYHVALIYEDVSHRAYEICKEHRQLVQEILTNFDPLLYDTFIRSFSRLNFLEQVANDLKSTKPEEYFCQEEIFNEIFDDFKNAPNDSRRIRSLLCGDSGKKFITDFYGIFYLENFEEIVENTLLTLVTVAFDSSVTVEKANLTSLVTSVRDFASYFKSSNSKAPPDWSIFSVSQRWSDVFTKNIHKGRLDILGMHLSIAKMVGSQSLTYLTIKPDLQNMDKLADKILMQLHAKPNDWIDEIRRRKFQLIESFYLTVTDREKTLKILEYSNFTQSYCSDPHSPSLLNFPRGSNETLLKELLCRVAEFVESDLRMSFSELEVEEATYKKRQDFNWTAFNEKTMEIYDYVDALVQQESDEKNDYDWAKKLQRLKSDFRTAWTINLTAIDAWEISVGLLCKFFDVIESPIFGGFQSKMNKMEDVYALAWATSVVFDSLEGTLDRISENDRVLRLSEMLQDLPQTEILLHALLANLPAVILDAVDLVSLRLPVHLISTIDQYKTREGEWPCVRNESIGAALELRNGSRSVVREIERIACNPGLFMKEWREEPVLTKARRILQRNGTLVFPPFNWTLGYLNFRRIAHKFDVLINDTADVVLAENPELSMHLRRLIPAVESMFDERLPKMKVDSKNFLDYIDLELDKALKVFHSNLTASDVWTEKEEVQLIDRLLVFSKFFSHMIHETLSLATDILLNGTEKISLLSLLGFNGQTVLSIVHDKLPYILSTFVNGLSDATLDRKIYEALENGTIISCTQLFDWWSDFRVGLNPQEYMNLKNFACHLDPENFNSYVDLYTSEMATYTKPVSTYRCYIATAIGDVYNFARIARKTMKLNVTIEQPFSGDYFKEVAIKLRDSLETYDGENGRNKKIPVQPYGIVTEALSEVLLRTAETLESVKIDDNDGRLPLWKLSRNGDVRQLLKIFEAHPEETIALVASLLKMADPSHGIIPFTELRREICSFHFNSSYWTKANRSRFLMEICTFDPYQLLKTATSSELHDAVVGRTNFLLRLTPMSVSLTRLLDAISNLTETRPSIVFESTVLNVSTWEELSNETWKLIEEGGSTLIHCILHQYTMFDSPKEIYVALTRQLQMLNFQIDVLSGGDVWQKLRSSYENSRMKAILNLVEDTPNLLLTAVDTFLTSERLDDFVEKLWHARINPCDIDRYLIPPTFVRKKTLLSSVANFCQRIVMSEKVLAVQDFLPIDYKAEQSLVLNDTLPSNVTYLSGILSNLQRTLRRVISQGYKDPKVPAWWMSFEEGTLKDFSSLYKSKDLRSVAHSAVKKVATLVGDLLGTDDDNAKNCSWCSTLMIEIVNSQLSHHRRYAQLLCDLNRLNASEIHDILNRDFYWNKTANMLKDFQYLNTKRTPSDLVRTVEGTLHYIADIIVDHQNETYDKRVAECLRKFVGEPAYSRPGLYTFLLTNLLNVLQKNVGILDTASNHQNLLTLSSLSEKFVAIWKPLREVVKKSDVEEVDAFLPNAIVNVNAILSDRKNTLCRSKADCRNSTIIYSFLTSRRSSRVLRYDAKAANYPSLVDISALLARALDLDLISRQTYHWRDQESWQLTWLKELLRHMSNVLFEGGNLLDVVANVDFQNMSDVLNIPDIVDGVVNVIKNKTIDKLFLNVEELLDDVEAFVEEEEIMEDLRSMVAAIESMEIFKNLGLLDVKYAISDMFDDWDLVRRYLIDRTAISKEAVLSLSEAKIDMLSIFTKERRTLTFKDTICSPSKLEEILDVDESSVSVQEISVALCSLNDTQTQNITVALLKNLNFRYIFNTLLSANVKNILSNANLTEAEGKMVLDNLAIASELLPFFKDKLAGSLPAASFDGDEDTTQQPISSSQFLKDCSTMLCGKTLINDDGRLYKIIASIKDNSMEYDKVELDSLPSDFCRDTYKSILAMNGGKIIWSYVKPLLRGQILYAPNSSVVDKVMALANESFVQMEHLAVLMNSLERTLTSLASLSEMGDTLNELQDIMTSKVMKIAIKSLVGGNLEGDFSRLKFGEMAWKLKRSKKLVHMVGMLNGLIECVLMNRMKGFSTEEEMEVHARSLMKTNEFLAGVVFLEDKSSNGSSYPSRFKRSLDYELPDNVIYKIRMDVDYVPSTRRLKNQFWTPGAESSFIEDLRYLRGFVQLQDSIDRAVIALKSQKNFKWKTLTQQMPYPCWTDVPFQTTLYESQGLQVCFFFALMMCVGSAVRYIVWERESQNSMVMSVMGLKPWRNTLAWFITTFIEVSIIMFSIALILLFGKILPRSDPFLVLILLLDYSFSIVTFCYMISTMFSSASLSAITTVVMFLLTYMPYVIVVAMEAAMGLGYKLLISLSMSTSFCYGCLYAVRKEVQGTGLTWSNVWEESSPGDPMSFGLVLFMIAFDACIYAVVGYLVTRYTNSGRGFHSLRSRSLWWADTRSLNGRPSYLAFVNNLYFTNDVLHPSSTYQDEGNDADSLTVNEKQNGVRFEGVRKVYSTPMGDVVAVDDFTLKLYEGEVTSLLGRNGAGKTTIIKMLTGMLAPTSGEICLNGEEGYKPDIGVCPQDNVLIATLTPREHMIFYAKLKGPRDDANMERNVNEMLASLQLGRQEHEPVYRLSGGTKRRLCVALAFLGSPRLVILDEPGAGIDPAARLRIWRLIDRHRVGRTVLLSTHHLDEADMLSDTVVVMHKGKILCTGSPLTLKMNHGQGYRLHVSFPSDGQPNSDSVKRKSLEILGTIVRAVVPDASMSKTSVSEVLLTLPFRSVKHSISVDVAQVAKVLEENRELLGFSHFSFECDNLERVFLDLCARADGIMPLNGASLDSIATSNYTELSISDEDVDLIDVELVTNPSPIKQTKALLKKRLWHFAKDWRSPLAALVLPVIFVAVAMGFSLIRPPSADEPPLTLNPKLYDVHPTYFYSIDNSNDPFLQHVSLQLHDRFGDDYAGAWQTMPNDTGTCECLDGQQSCHGVSQAVEGLVQTLAGRPTLDWIVSTHHEYIEKRYGGWSLSHSKDEPLFVVWYNNKGHHSMPAYLNALNEAVLRASGVRGHLTVQNHPLKLSSDQLNRTTLLQHVADVGIALVLLIAFSLVGAQGTRELARERLSEEKRILYLAGVHPVTYWTAALIWDFLVFGCSICLAVVVFEIFGLSTYVARDNLPGVCLLLFLYAWAIIPFAHLAEKAFDEASLAHMVLFCVNTFIGVSSLATILVIDILGKTQTATDVRNVLHYVFMVLPQYVLGDSLVELSKNDITAELLQKFHMNTYKSPLGWELLGLHYVFLILVGGILFLLNLTIECRLLPDPRRRKRVNYEELQEDEDVAKERRRVEVVGCEDTLRTVKLRKEYLSVYGTNVAVQNLSFGVQAGRCFGLLGVNGAGKSTTFRMLTTEIIPTAGRIYLKGTNVGRGPLCNREVGYCPQSDALDGFLTPHQSLTIHAEVCGLRNVQRIVESVLKRFDLLKYAHRRIDRLSGGNKRKLCAAISVLAPISVLLMDEPTSGMDPATKDLVSKAIARMTKNQTCVILTSHSVADCESLCDTVGILAKAGLRCIGTPQHLKHRFGEGYVVFLRFGQPTSMGELRRATSKHLPQAIICSRQANAARLLLPRNQDIPLSVSFGKVKELAEELKTTDYTLTQSSLDQVLVNFSEELEEEAIDTRRSSDLSNVYTNRDSICMETL